MGTINFSIETEYDRGDVVIFKTGDCIKVGIIESYYVDTSCDNSIWYDIRISKTFVYTYSNKGDICENQIIGKLDDKLSNEAKKVILEIKDE